MVLSKIYKMKKMLAFSLIFFGLTFVFSSFVFSSKVLADNGDNTVSSAVDGAESKETAGPFAKLMEMLASLFYSTRNLLYIGAGFAVILFAAKWIKDGKIEWDKLGFLIIALIILALAGTFIKYAAYKDQDGFDLKSTIEADEDADD